jgi:Polyketide cyclase / dehydrase and lipid transport
VADLGLGIRVGGVEGGPLQIRIDEVEDGCGVAGGIALVRLPDEDRVVALHPMTIGRVVSARQGMIRPTSAIQIAAGPSTVIGFIAHPANASRWKKALEEAELLTPGPIGAGARFREVMSAGGGRIEAVCEIVEFDRERRYAWRSVGGGLATYGACSPPSRSTEAPSCGTRAGRPRLES